MKNVYYNSKDIHYCAMKNGAISSRSYHLTLNNQGMLIKYFYINKVYFPLGTSIETDAFN